MRAIKITEKETDRVYVDTYFYYKNTWYCLEQVYGGYFEYSDELLSGLTADMIRNRISRVDNVTIFKENVIVPNEYKLLIKLLITE